MYRPYKWNKENGQSLLAANFSFHELDQRAREGCKILELIWRGMLILGLMGTVLCIFMSIYFVSLDSRYSLIALASLSLAFFSWISRPPLLSSPTTDLGNISDRSVMDLVVFGAIQALRSRTAGEPRDKAYALYGVLAGVNCRLTTPDYSKTISSVYRDFLVDLLVWSPYLIFLLLDAASTSVADWPSWVPDWSRKDSLTWLSQDYFSGSSKVNATPQSIPYVIVDESRLTLHGILADRIEFSSGDLGIPDQDTQASEAGDDEALTTSKEERCMHLLLRWVIAFKTCARVISANHSIPRAIFDALEGRETVRNDTWQPHFNAWYDTIRNIDSGTESNSSVSALVRDALERITADSDAHTYLTRCVESIVEKRSLFVTHLGYVGSGRLSVRCGDHISLIAGVPAPLVLRDSFDEGDHKHVVGAAVVIGMMNGEVWKNGQTASLITLI